MIDGNLVIVYKVACDVVRWNVFDVDGAVVAGTDRGWRGRRDGGAVVGGWAVDFRLSKSGIRIGVKSL